MLTVRALVVAGLMFVAGCSKGSGEGGDSSGSGSDPSGSADDDSPTGGADTIYACVEHCEANPDCMRDGVDAGYRCQDGACVFEPKIHCIVDDDCIIFDNGFIECGGPADCSEYSACVDLGDGQGYCVETPRVDTPCIESHDLEAMFPAIDGSGPVAVCIQSSQCNLERKTCEARCLSDAYCYETLPHCNVDSGHCECDADAQCINAEYAPTGVCNAGVCGCGTDMDCPGKLTRCLPDHTCGCAADAECLKDNTQTDKCFDGVCGCSGDAGCPPRLAAMDATCEPR